MEQRVSQSFFTQYVSVILIVLTILLSTLSQPRTVERAQVVNRGVAFKTLPEASDWLAVDLSSGDSFEDKYLSPREALLNSHDLILEVEVRAPTFVVAQQQASEFTRMWESRSVQGDAVRVSLLVEPLDSKVSMRERWLHSMHGTAPLSLPKGANL